jgi:hypothetical protein
LSASSRPLRPHFPARPAIWSRGSAARRSSCPPIPAPPSVSKHRVRQASRPADGVLIHLDALFALAFLQSGDPASARDAVAGAFSSICGIPLATHACQSVMWRTLADHVHNAASGCRGWSASGPVPFRESSHTKGQREAVALYLGGRRGRDAARLLGISVNEHRLLLHQGSVALRAARLISLFPSPE